jgi:acetyl esterase/lipase
MDDPRTRPVVLSLPGMDRAQVRTDVAYRQDPELRFDLYRPLDDGPDPCVILVHGDGAPEVLANAKAWGQYTSWGRLAAASGLAAVAFDHRSTERFTRLVDAADDVDRLIAFVRSNGSDLGVDPDRLALWVCSMGPPVALRTILRSRPPFLRCIAVFYGVMDLRPLRANVPEEVSDQILEEFSPVLHLAGPGAALPPMLLARAGLEERPWLNPTIDAFVSAALVAGVELDLLHHPTGRHGFDVLDDDERSRDIVARTLAFLRRHLLTPHGP